MITNDDRRIPADPSTIELTNTTHLTITKNVTPNTPNTTRKRDTPASPGHPLTRRLPTRTSATLNKVDRTLADIRADYRALRYEVIELPGGVEHGIRRFMAESGLVMASMDFSVGRDGRFYFLESNPAGGQYGWLEDKAGVALTEAVADVLAQDWVSTS
jgi:hypothetical protein